MVKTGSKWAGADYKEFTVLARVELSGNIWVHYRNNQGQEFSCYEDAFKSRFTELPNEQR
jgi:hypothetical protein